MWLTQYEKSQPVLVSQGKQLNHSKAFRPSIGAVDLLFCLYVLIWWLEIGLRVELLGRLRFEFLVGACLGIIAIIRIAQGNIIFINPITNAILFYLVVLLLTVPFSINPLYSWNIYLNRVIKLAMMSFFMLAFIRTVFQLKLYLLSTFIAFFKIGYESLYGKLTGSMVWQNQGIMRLHGTQGSMFGHPNSLSGKFLGVFPFIWYLFPSATIWWKKLFAIMLIFMMNILIFTGSRTGYMTFVLMLLYISFRSQKKTKLLTLLFAVFLMAMILVPQQYQERFISSFTGQEAEGRSSDTRKALFFDSMDVFAENPLGVGIGGFRIVQHMEGRTVQETHNLYTQILSETGIQGFIAFGLLIVVIFRQNKKRLLWLEEKQEQIQAYRNRFEGNSSQLEAIGRFSAETNFMINVCRSIHLFLLVRLILGVFGHDQYEMYWWIAAGTVMAIEECGNSMQIEFEKISGMQCAKA